ncbi:MAG: AmmeMemoRadiSam system radical SAM enzyme, partial [Candidatus Woesearchaeota archaeon]
MKEALFYKIENNSIKCMLCPHNCIIDKGKLGLCKVRINIDNKLYSKVYFNPVSLNIDPIEKKPLYHFLPLTKTLSIGTVGCNMKCMHCQNFEISQFDNFLENEKKEPKEIVDIAIKNKCESISYTYNEPTIFFEYVYDIAKIAKENNIKNVLVTNGFINKEPAKMLCEVIDAVNVDLKAFNEEFYKKICFAKLKDVKNTLKIFYENDLHLEITYLVIDKLNDDLNEIEEMCKWIKKNLNENIPIHFSKAFPMYKMQNIIPTPTKTLIDIEKIAKKYLNYVYLGNLNNDNNIYCPNCKKLILERFNYDKQFIKNNKCVFCNKKIFGVF